MGTCAITAYSVSRRTAEIGLRMAMGAEARRVLLSVLAHGLRPAAAAAAGLVLGLAAAADGAAAIRALLFAVEPLDPISFGSVALVMLTTTAVACYLPARRASRIDPVIALRDE